MKNKINYTITAPRNQKMLN